MEENRKLQERNCFILMTITTKEIRRDIFNITYFKQRKDRSMFSHS